MKGWTIWLAGMTMALAVAVGCNKSEATGAAGAKPATGVPDKDGRIAISVGKEGFAPDGLKVKKATPYTLVFTRTTDQTCAKEVVVQLGGGKTVQKELPLNQAVEIPVTFADAGELRYACGMDMVKGSIHVE